MIKTTNIRTIVDKLMLGSKIMQDMPFEVAIVRAIEFIELMGTPALYDEKTAKVEVKDWKGELPCDFVQMIQVRDAATDTHHFPGPAYRKSEDSFHMSPEHKPYNSSLTYKVQHQCIFTSTRNTTLEIAYRAFAIDDEGLPLLPDNTSFLRGLELYIKMRWLEAKYETGDVPYDVMERADREYAWAAGDAQSEFSRQDLDDAETLANVFHRLLPSRFDHARGYYGSGAKEIWHTH